MFALNQTSKSIFIQQNRTESNRKYSKRKGKRENCETVIIWKSFIDLFIIILYC